MSEYTKFIRAKLSDRELLEQLAEESIEIGKAALKLIRAKGYSNNVTPVDAEEAQANLSEEVWDLAGVLFILGYDLRMMDTERYWKMQRWAKRLGYKEDKDGGK